MILAFWFSLYGYIQNKLIESLKTSFLVWKSPHYFSWSTLATFWKNDYLYKSAAMPLLSMQSTHYATCYFFIFFCLYLFIWVLSQIDTFMWNGIAKIVKKSCLGKSYCQKVGHNSHMRGIFEQKLVTKAIFFHQMTQKVGESSFVFEITIIHLMLVTFSKFYSFDRL